MKSIIPVLFFGVLLSSSAQAKHWHDDDKYWDQHERHGDDDHRAANCYFQPHDVRVISDYYAPQYRKLPPGLRKKYNRIRQLPPGWQKRFRPLPPQVERQLAPLPSGYQRGVVDGYAVIYDPRTQVTIDITAVFGGR
jgi:hypothetical protein